MRFIGDNFISVWFDLNSKVVFHSVFGLLSPLVFFNYASHPFKALTNANHTVRERCAFVVPIFDIAFTVMIGCSHTIRESLINQSWLFQDAEKEAIPNSVIDTNDNRIYNFMKKNRMMCSSRIQSCQSLR